MASGIWLRTILIVRKETCCRHIGYSYRLTARVLLYAPSHCLCYTSCGALARTRNSSMGPPHEGSIQRPTAPWANALPLSYVPLPGCHRSKKLATDHHYWRKNTPEMTGLANIRIKHKVILVVKFKTQILTVKFFQTMLAIIKDGMSFVQSHPCVC